MIRLAFNPAKGWFFRFSFREQGGWRLVKVGPIADRATAMRGAKAFGNYMVPRG